MSNPVYFQPNLGGVVYYDSSGNPLAIVFSDGSGSVNEIYLFWNSSITDYGSAPTVGSIAWAIGQLNTSGGRINLSGVGPWPIVTGIATGTKVLRLTGTSQSEILSGSGLTLITLQSSRSSVENLTIADTIGNTDTIAIDINNGSTGVDNWLIKNCNILGTSNLGIGIRMLFGLKGVLSDNVIESWNYGTDHEPSGINKSNANAYIGNKIRVNSYGIYIGTGGADDSFLSGNTVEGNNVGLRNNDIGSVVIVGGHFENNLGVAHNIELYSGSVITNGVTFASATTNCDIIIESGNAYSSTSIGDTFNSGITHNGSGNLDIYSPKNVPPSYTGSGFVTIKSGNTVMSAALGGGSQYAYFNNFATYAFDNFISGRASKPLKLIPLDSTVDIVDFYNNAGSEVGSIDKSGNVSIPSLEIKTGGSTTISTGVGSVKMSSANSATNTVWIPIKYNGTVYYVPGFTTNSP